MLRLEPDESIRCATSLTEFGQGTDSGTAQVVAAALGVSHETVHVETGDSASTPFGGGSRASRGMASDVGWRAGRMLRQSILRNAGQVMQKSPEALDIRDGNIVDAEGAVCMSMNEIADIMHYRRGSIPPVAAQRLP